MADGWHLLRGLQLGATALRGWWVHLDASVCEHEAHSAAGDDGDRRVTGFHRRPHIIRGCTRRYFALGRRWPELGDSRVADTAAADLDAHRLAALCRGWN